MSKFKQWLKEFFSHKEPSCIHYCVEERCRPLAGMTVYDGHISGSWITVVHYCHCDKCGADLSWDENIEFEDE
jgi:hypothetical protein